MSETQLTVVSTQQQPVGDSPLHMSLRQSTQQYHIQLHHHPLLAGLTKPGYPLASYRKLLIAYFHLYQEIETRINQFLLITSGDFEFDYVGRCKLPWLLNDLAFLQDDPFAVENLPSRAIALPKIDNIGQLIGVLYTIEGSMLGGQKISHCITSNYGYTQTEGASFFYGYGENTMFMWQHFISFMNSISADNVQRQAAEKAAEMTFQLFKQVLDDYNCQHLNP